MMKRLFLFFTLVLAVAFQFENVSAATISLLPPTQTVNLGEPFIVDVAISGLGNQSPFSLSTFDVDVTYESMILSFPRVSYGDPGLGDQLDLFASGSTMTTAPATGGINLFELSFDLPSDLDTLQPDAFVLARLTFNSRKNGNSPLGIRVNALGDADGVPIVPTALNAGQVQVVPIPKSVWLFVSGLAGLWIWKRKFKGACV